MDFINKLAGGNDNHNTDNSQHSGGQHNNSEHSDHSGGGSFLDGLKDKLNSAAGGGPEAEKKEDLLDKSIDFVQEKFLGQGQQSNESAAEQMKDELIASYIRKSYKQVTGSEFPIGDKKH